MSKQTAACLMAQPLCSKEGPSVLGPQLAVRSPQAAILRSPSLLPPACFADGILPLDMEASELLSDTFEVLSSKEIKLLAMRNKVDKDLPVEEEDLALANVVLQEAQKKLISQVSVLLSDWATRPPGTLSPESWGPPYSGLNTHPGGGPVCLPAWMSHSSLLPSPHLSSKLPWSLLWRKAPLSPSSQGSRESGRLGSTLLGQ